MAEQTTSQTSVKTTTETTAGKKNVAKPVGDNKKTTPTKNDRPKFSTAVTAGLIGFNVVLLGIFIFLMSLVA